MLYKTATPEELRSAYWEERNRLARIGELASMVRNPAARRTLARQTESALRRFDIICAVARKRDIDLLEVTR